MQIMVIAALDAMHPQHAQLLGQGLVIRDHHPAVAVRPEVLGRIKTEAGIAAEGARHPTAIPRAVRLRVVKQWDTKDHYPTGIRDDLGGQTLDTKRCRIFGVAALRYLGGEPAVNPLVTERVGPDTCWMPFHIAS